MSNPSLPEEQLLELLLQLKKTTPDSARTILNSQPQIAYALITLMVNMNAINVDVLHKTVAAYGAQAQPSTAPLPLAAAPLPQYLQTQYRTSTPPTLALPTAVPLYPYSNGHPQPSFGQIQHPPGLGSTPPPPVPFGHGNTALPSGFPNYTQSYSIPQLPVQPAANMSLPDTLATMPDDQKAVIVRVLSMTPEQINQLPPTERANIIQLRATLGLPSG